MSQALPSNQPPKNQKRNVLVRFLDGVEWLGNKLPDPVVLFMIGILIVWFLSRILSNVEFEEIDPRGLAAGKETPIAVVNMLSLSQMAKLLSIMVKEFVTFPPLGLVLVALLGVGVAEKAGFINAIIKSILDVTPKSLLTPMVIFVAVISHTAADAGYVLVIPLAGLMFHAAGRHPLVGIAAAFAGVSGGFSANFIPSGIDPLLAGLTDVGASVRDKDYSVNILCNWYFTAASSFLVIGVGWFVTDWIVEPKLKGTPIDGDVSDVPRIEALTGRDRVAMWSGLAVLGMGAVLVTTWAIPADSALRDKLGSLTSNRNQQTEIGFDLHQTDAGWLIKNLEPGSPGQRAGFEEDDIVLSINDQSVVDLLSDKPIDQRLAAGTAYLIESQRGDQIRHDVLTPQEIPGAPLMAAIVPLIFLLFVFPGIVHGYVSGNFKNHRDVIAGMSHAMESMAYYLVLVFFVALFIYVFNNSNIGLLVAVKGANMLKDQPPIVIILGIILLTGLINLLVGSASAKWAMLAPIFVPMLMLLGISPELAQAAYRVGDSTTNIITPLLPYFPLVVIFCQRYYKHAGIGTLTSMMLPYSISLMVLWSAFLIVYWQLGIPLGIEAPYDYTPTQ